MSKLIESEDRILNSKGIDEKVLHNKLISGKIINVLPLKFMLLNSSRQAPFTNMIKVRLN